MDEDHSPVDLQRFMDAQRDTYAQALRELQGGRKRSHWMWFIFPQLEGLGRSPTAQHFALRSLHEARAYLVHPILGVRLRDATRAVLAHRDQSLLKIFGQPDDMKFRSSMTPTSRERRKLSPEGPGTRFGRGDAEITAPHILVNEHWSDVKI